LRFQDNTGFRHPIYQTSLILTGQWLNYFTFIIPLMFAQRRLNHYGDLITSSEAQKKSSEFPIHWMALSAFFDIVASFCQSTSLFLVEPSIYQMLKGGVILGCCFLSRCFLKTQIYRHHVLALTFTVLGFIIVALASMLKAEGGASQFTTSQTTTGILLLMVGILFQSAQFVTQEYVLRKYAVDPARLVGLEGVFGVPMAIIMCFCFVALPCPDSSICDIGASWDDPTMAVIQIFSDTKLMLLVFGLLISIKCFNLAGMYVTRNINSVVRSYLDIGRTVLVWIISLCVGLDVFVWDCFVLEFLGFVLLIFGTNIYSETIELKCYNMNKYLSKYRIAALEEASLENELGKNDKLNFIGVDSSEEKPRKKSSFSKMVFEVPRHKKSSEHAISPF